MSVASHANAAASDGTQLVPICTSDGVRMVVISSDGQEQQAPSDQHHQCPLCIVGCASCAVPTLPMLFATVVMLFAPATTAAPQVAVEPALPRPPLFSTSATPRGPPALA